MKGEWLDWMILWVFSNLGDFMILCRWLRLVHVIKHVLLESIYYPLCLVCAEVLPVRTEVAPNSSVFVRVVVVCHFFSFSLSNKCPSLEILKPQKMQKDSVRYILIEGQPRASSVLDFLDMLNEKFQVALLLCGLQLRLSNCWLCASLTSGSFLPTPLSDLCSSCASPRDLSKTCARKIIY